MGFVFALIATLASAYASVPVEIHSGDWQTEAIFDFGNAIDQTNAQLPTRSHLFSSMELSAQRFVRDFLSVGLAASYDTPSFAPQSKALGPVAALTFAAHENFAPFVEAAPLEWVFATTGGERACTVLRAGERIFLLPSAAFAVSAVWRKEWPADARGFGREWGFQGAYAVFF